MSTHSCHEACSPGTLPAEVAVRQQSGQSWPCMALPWSLPREPSHTGDPKKNWAVPQTAGSPAVLLTFHPNKVSTAPPPTWDPQPGPKAEGRTQGESQPRDGRPCSSSSSRRLGGAHCTGETRLSPRPLCAAPPTPGKAPASTCLLVRSWRPPSGSDRKMSTGDPRPDRDRETVTEKQSPGESGSPTAC